MNNDFDLSIIISNIEKLCGKKNVKNELLNAGVSRNVVENMKKGSMPSIDKIAKIADYFGVTTDYLLGNSPVRHGGMEIQMIDDESYVPIPVIGEVAAGYQALAETNIIGYELVSSDTLHDGYEYAWLKVKGDSMSPLIMEGDLVLVRLQDEIESGELAVVIVDEEDGVIKRVKYSTRKVTLISENAEKYPPRVFEGKDIDRLRIWGKAIDLKRKLN